MKNIQTLLLVALIFLLSGITRVSRLQLTAKIVISPSQLTSNQNDYNPTGFANAEIVNISSDAGMRTITGFNAPASGFEIDKTVINTGIYPVIIAPEHSGSSAANRVTYSSEIIILPKYSITLIYNTATSRWYVQNYSVGNLFGAGTKVSTFMFAASSVTAADQPYWATSSTGTGAAISSNAASTTVPSAMNLTTGTTSTGQTALYVVKTMQTIGAFGTQYIMAKLNFFLVSLSNGTDTYTAGFRIQTSPTTTTTDVNNSIGVRYTHGTNSGKFQFFTRSNSGSETTLDSGVTAAANTVYEVIIVVNKQNDEARFYFDGIPIGRITTTMPNAGTCGVQTYINKSVGVSSRSISIVNFNTTMLL